MTLATGPLQTSEHILARIVEEQVENARVVIAKFYDEYGIVEFSSEKDLRELDWNAIEHEVNEVIAQDLNVTIEHVGRNTAEKKFDLTRLPQDLQEIRIVSIGDFDMRPCKDPHVSNTKEIGLFCIENVKRVGKDRYRVTFRVN